MKLTKKEIRDNIDKGYGEMPNKIQCILIDDYNMNYSNTACCNTYVFKDNIDKKCSDEGDYICKDCNKPTEIVDISSDDIENALEICLIMN